jgi:hypothetical protein
MMEFDIRMPQLTEVQTRLDELFNHVDALHRKLDDLTLAAAAPGPVAQPEAPAPVQEKAPAKRGRKAAAAPAATPAANGEAEDTDEEDEDTLRARVEFEEKRVRRLFGINGARAAISKAADGVLRIDDVPAARLTAVLTALQAL